MLSYLLDIAKVVDTAVCQPRYTYPMKRNAPRPDGDYAAIQIAKTIPIGVDFVQMVEYQGEDVQVVTGARVLEVDVLFSRDEDKYFLFHSSFNRQDVINKCDSLGLGFQQMKEVNIKDLTLETDWEVRKAFKVYFNVAFNLRVPTCDEEMGDYIDSATIEGTFHDADKEIPLEAVINKVE
jgi:hypothetical protein